jgi:hypothetical protein
MVAANKEQVEQILPEMPNWFNRSQEQHALRVPHTAVRTRIQ